MNDIFISYASEDRERVRPIKELLERVGWRVFWDRDIPGGKRWDRCIDRYLENSLCVIVVWSETSISREFVLSEASYARDNNKIVPVKIDHITPPTEFRRRQVIDLTDWTNDPSDFRNKLFIESVESYAPLSQNKFLIGEYDYEQDQDKIWHHLDKWSLKEKFEELCLNEEMVKVLFVEYDIEDHLSRKIHEILYSYFKPDAPSLGNIKGAVDSFLHLDDSESLYARWMRFMKREFSLYSAGSKTEDFRSIDKQPYFVVQSIKRFHADNFMTYYGFWKKLDFAEPIILFFYVEAEALRDVASCKNMLHCRYDEHKFVKRNDFDLFFNRYNDYYIRDAELCKCDQICFQEAVERLRYKRAVQPYSR